jgi:Pyroglutamyl peptidase
MGAPHVRATRWSEVGPAALMQVHRSHFGTFQRKVWQVGALVITAFDAFGGMSANPAGVLVRDLADRRDDFVSVTIPTSFHRVGFAIDQVFNTNPFGVLMFGYTRRADRLTIEHLARNRDRSARRDNDGHVGDGIIAVDGPAILASNLDIVPTPADTFVTTVTILRSDAPEREQFRSNAYLSTSRFGKLQPRAPNC